MLMTDVAGDYVGDNFEILETDSLSYRHNHSATNIILAPSISAFPFFKCGNPIFERVESTVIVQPRGCIDLIVPNK